jgi:hypothetical protein
MARYQKNPILIDAEQFFQDEYDATNTLPTGACDCAMALGMALGMVHVHTLEGPYPLRHLDWIVCGTAGEYYPVREDIFKATYTLVPPTPPAEGSPC